MERERYRDREKIGDRKRVIHEEYQTSLNSASKGLTLVRPR